MTPIDWGITIFLTLCVCIVAYRVVKDLGHRLAVIIARGGQRGTLR